MSSSRSRVKSALGDHVPKPTKPNPWYPGRDPTRSGRRTAPLASYKKALRQQKGYIRNNRGKKRTKRTLVRSVWREFNTRTGKYAYKYRKQPLVNRRSKVLNVARRFKYTSKYRVRGAINRPTNWLDRPSNPAYRRARRRYVKRRPTSRKRGRGMQIRSIGERRKKRARYTNP